MECQYCKKHYKNAGGLTMHERSCHDNLNRVPGTFAGKTHSLSTRKLQAKSVKSKVPNNLFEVSSRTLQKIMKRMNAVCSNCGWDKTTCDIHHMKPKKHGGTDDHNNLTVLCPNCHRLAHENKLTEMISIEKQYGEKWRDFYFSHE